jgi:hypothetical protein
MMGCKRFASAFDHVTVERKLAAGEGPLQL